MKEQLSLQQRTQSLYFNVAPDVWGTKDLFVNMYFLRNPDTLEWVMVDTGLKGSHVRIKKVAEALFGPLSRPSAIVLTHGHFDHAGSVRKLADDWNVQIYTHYLELPYLSGRSSYPPADPKVGGGLMSKVSTLYPKKPIDVEGRLHILPPDGSVPFLTGWHYIHTPGHAPGHVSLFRPKDRVLIAGDAFVTTKPESVMSIMMQTPKLSGPPKYFTYDWEAAAVSVKNLAELEPRIVATGHGRPMAGEGMRMALNNLSAHFQKQAVPNKGRYINNPAVTNAGGIVYLPPKPKDNTLLHVAIALGVAAAGFAWLYATRRKKKKTVLDRISNDQLIKLIKEAL